MIKMCILYYHGLEIIKYDVLKKKIDVSSMNSTFAKEVEYIFSKDGYGKEKIILSNGYIIQERTITEKKKRDTVRNDNR